MAKPRSDSLYARLTPSQRDAVFAWLFDEGRRVEDVAKQITANIGIDTSPTAVSALCKRHAFDWKVDRAKELANDKATTFPADFDAKKRARLAQAEFEKVFNELSLQEVISLQRLEMDREDAKMRAEIELEKLRIARVRLEQKERGMQFDREKFAVSTCQLFLKWFADTKAKEIAEANISNTEKINQLRQLYFADVDELERSGQVEIPE